jgi:hypothetical protein
MQSRLESFVEAWVNIVIGFGVSLLAQIIIFPLFGIDIEMWENLSIAAFFTVISLVRSYLLRRYFNHRLKAWLTKQQKEEQV